MDEGTHNQEMTENWWKMWTANVSQKMMDPRYLSAVEVISGMYYSDKNRLFTHHLDGILFQEIYPHA